MVLSLYSPHLLQWMPDEVRLLLPQIDQKVWSFIGFDYTLIKNPLLFLFNNVLHRAVSSSALTYLWCRLHSAVVRLFAGGHWDYWSWRGRGGKRSYIGRQMEQVQHQIRWLNIPISSWMVTRSRTLKDVSSFSGWEQRWHTKLTCMVVLDVLEPSIAG